MGYFRKQFFSDWSLCHFCQINALINLPPVFFGMIEGTFETFEALLFLARQHLVHQRMKVLFFPSVSKRTCLQAVTSFFVTCNERSTLPIGAQIDSVVEKVGSSSKILEIVGIDTLRLVVFVIKRTPLRFKEKHEEVKVTFGWYAAALIWPRRMVNRRKLPTSQFVFSWLFGILGHYLVNQPSFEIFNGMRKRAKVAIFTLADFWGVKVAKFGLVFVCVIQPFNSVVGSAALLLFRTLNGFCKLTQFGRIKTLIPSHVLFWVKVRTCFVVVRLA